MYGADEYEHVVGNILGHGVDEAHVFDACIVEADLKMVGYVLNPIGVNALHWSSKNEG